MHPLNNRRGGKSVIARVIFPLLFTLTLSAAAADLPAADNGILLTYQNGRLSLQAQQKTLSTILQRIADMTCVEFHLPESEIIDKQENWKVDDLPLEEALQNLLRPYNTVLYRDTDAKSKSSTCIVVRVLQASSVTPPASTQFTSLSEAERLTALISSSAPLQQRRQAIDALTALPTAEAMAALEKAFTVTEPELRREVVRALSQVAKGATPRLLGQIVASDPDITVREAAIQALSGRNDTVAQLFLRRAQLDTDARIRDASTKALSPAR